MVLQQATGLPFAISPEQAKMLDVAVTRCAKHYGVTLDGPMSSLVHLSAVSVIVYGPKMLIIGAMMKQQKMAKLAARGVRPAPHNVVGMDGRPLTAQPQMPPGGGEADAVDISAQVRGEITPDQQAPAVVADTVNKGMDDFGYTRA